MQTLNSLSERNGRMDKGAKIYVAGHRGLVGSALCRRLADDGYTNIVTRTSSELDLRRQAVVEAFFQNERPDFVSSRLRR